MQERAVRRIAKYLASTSTYVNLPKRIRRVTTHGVVYRPDTEEGIDSYVDVNFSGGWAQAEDDNAEISCRVRDM